MDPKLLHFIVAILESIGMVTLCMVVGVFLPIYIKEMIQEYLKKKKLKKYG